MLTVGKKILIGAAVALPIAGYSYYKYAENNLGFDIVGGSINSISNGVANLNLQYKVTSKIGVSFNVLALNLNIYVNNIFVGTVQQPQAVVVPAKGFVIVPTVTQIDISKIESSALSLLLSALTGGGIEAYINGYCQAQVNVAFLSFFNINVPVDQSVKLIGG